MKATAPWARSRCLTPAGFDCRVASQVEDLDVKNHVPKSYRKAIKVMARDIKLAVVAADLAAKDAGLVTRGNKTDSEAACSYESSRMGAHIGSGLIAADLDELTAALAAATDEKGDFDYHKWGDQRPHAAHAALAA